MQMSNTKANIPDGTFWVTVAVTQSKHSQCTLLKLESKMAFKEKTCALTPIWYTIVEVVQRNTH